MTIGEQIIAAINSRRMVCQVEDSYFWDNTAAERLTALVEAHVEEQVKMRLEELMGKLQKQLQAEFIKRFSNDIITP